MFTAIMNVVDNRVAKFADFKTEDEALAHVSKFAERWPDAFVTATVPGGVPNWWVDGRTITIVPPTPAIPDRVTARQFKMQLEKDGLLSSVEAWVGQQAKLVRIAYDNSGTFHRSEPMMQAGFAALGFQAAQIDAFFTAASAL